MSDSGEHGHVPVLMDRCVELLTPALTRTAPDGSGAVLVDATLGAAGHAERFLTEFPALRLIGLDQGYLAGGHSWFTVETHIMHKDEAHAGDPVAVTIQMLAADEKRMHIFQTATREADGVVVATGEQMLLHVDTKAGRACPAEPGMRDKLLRIAAAQAGLPRPTEVGRHVGERRRA